MVGVTCHHAEVYTYIYIDMKKKYIYIYKLKAYVYKRISWEHLSIDLDRLVTMTSRNFVSSEQWSLYYQRTF